MQKLVNGQLIDLTPEEIAERQADELNWLAARPMKDWERKMSGSDGKLPRYVEDIIDALDNNTRNKIDNKTLAAYADKKAKRAERP